jgi:hypothetical protein
MRADVSSQPLFGREDDTRPVQTSWVDDMFDDDDDDSKGTS